MSEKVKKFLIAFLIAVAGIVCVISPTFELVQGNGSYYSFSYSGYDIFSSDNHITQYLSNNDRASLMVIVTALILIAIISIIAAFIVADFNIANPKITTIAIFIFILLFTFIYCIEGFHLISVVDSSRGSTLAYIPLLIEGVLFAISLFVCTINASEIDRGTLKVENEKANLLLSYKQLLDQGVITQEEYEAKKKELLN